MGLDGTALGPAAIAALAAAGLGFALRSARLVARGVRLARPLDLIRAIRLLALALVAALGALSVASGAIGFAVVGALILAEELYETAVVAAVIRLGETRT